MNGFLWVLRYSRREISISFISSSRVTLSSVQSDTMSNSRFRGLDGPFNYCIYVFILSWCVWSVFSAISRKKNFRSLMVRSERFQAQSITSALALHSSDSFIVARAAYLT